MGEPKTEPFLKWPPVHIDETRRAIVDWVRRLERELHDVQLALRECGDDVFAAGVGQSEERLTDAKDAFLRRPR